MQLWFDIPKQLLRIEIRPTALVPPLSHASHLDPSRAPHRQVHVHEDAEDGRHIVLMKGAPERVPDRCTHALVDGKIAELTRDARADVARRQEALSVDGLRCLGFAELALDPETYGVDYRYAPRRANDSPPAKLVACSSVAAQCTLSCSD